VEGEGLLEGARRERQLGLGAHDHGVELARLGVIEDATEQPIIEMPLLEQAAGARAVDRGPVVDDRGGVDPQLFDRRDRGGLRATGHDHDDDPLLGGGVETLPRVGVDRPVIRDEGAVEVEEDRVVVSRGHREPRGRLGLG
jgi:hypothetical protein